MTRFSHSSPEELVLVEAAAAVDVEHEPKVMAALQRLAAWAPEAVREEDLGEAIDCVCGWVTAGQRAVYRLTVRRLAKSA